MKIKFIDSDESSLVYNVGDIYGGNTRTSNVLNSDFSELMFDIIRPTSSIYVYNKSTGHREIAWSLNCQDVFLIVDPETNLILYTSKKYDCFHRGSDFMDELREAIDRGFAVPSKFELSSEVEFMDI